MRILIKCLIICLIILIHNLKFHFDTRINSIGFNFDHSDRILIDNVGNDTRMVTSISSNSQTA